MSLITGLYRIGVDKEGLLVPASKEFQLVELLVLHS